MKFVIYDLKKAKKALEQCPISNNLKILNCRHCVDCVYKFIGQTKCGITILNIENNLLEKYKLNCPFDAVITENGILKKCILCLNYYEKPICLGKGILIKYSKEEEEKIGKIVGCVINLGEIKEIIEDTKRYILYYDSNGDIHLYPKIFKPLIYELKYIKKILDIYKEFKGEFSFEDIIEDGIDDQNLKSCLMETINLYFKSNVLDMFSFDFLEEISMTSLKENLYAYHTKYGWIFLDFKIWTEKYFIDLINRISSKINRKFSIDVPRLNACLPNGDRIYCAAPPISKTHTFSIRRFKTKIITLEDFLNQEVISREIYDLLIKLINIDSNIIICGNTGSGKTTLLNAMLNKIINKNERFIVVEETPEIKLNYKHVVYLIGNISLKDLIYDTLRLRPDKVIVGEVRKDEEFEALFDAILAGQGKGVYATMHGLSAREAILRLKKANISDEDIEAVDLFITLRRFSLGKKEIRKVIELAEYVDGKINMICKYDFDKKNYVWNIENSKLINKLKLYDILIEENLNTYKA